jgi:serine/threonine protein kinase
MHRSTEFSVTSASRNTPGNECFEVSPLRGRKKKEVEQFIAEIEILKRLKHRHVVKFVGSYTDVKYIALIMTPIADRDLTTYLASVTPAKYPELGTFFGCLATALEFLHLLNRRWNGENRYRGATTHYNCSGRKPLTRKMTRHALAKRMYTKV